MLAALAASLIAVVHIAYFLFIKRGRRRNARFPSVSHDLAAGPRRHVLVVRRAGHRDALARPAALAGGVVASRRFIAAHPGPYRRPPRSLQRVTSLISVFRVHS